MGDVLNSTAALASVRSSATAAVSGAVANIGSAVNGAVSGGLSAASSAVSGVVGGAVSSINGAVASVGSVTSLISGGGLPGNVSGAVMSMVNGALPGLSGQASALLGIAANPLGQIPAMVSTNFSAAKSMIDAAKATAASVGSFSSVIDAAKAPVGLSQGLVGQATSLARSIFSSSLPGISNLANLNLGQLVGVGGLASQISDISGIIGGVSGVLAAGQSALASAGSAVLAGIGR